MKSIGTFAGRVEECWRREYQCVRCEYLLRIDFPTEATPTVQLEECPGCGIADMSFEPMEGEP